MKKSIKNVLIPLAALVLVPLLSGCGGQSPKDVAKKAVEAQLEEDMQTFYDLLCLEDQETMTYDNFVAKYLFPKDAIALFELVPEARNVLKASSFKEIKNGESATVTYVLTVPDMNRITKESINFNILQEMTSGRRMSSIADLPDEMKANIQEYIANNKVPTLDVPQSIDLIREDDNWRIRLNLRDALELGRMPAPFVLN